MSETERTPLGTDVPRPNVETSTAVTRKRRWAATAAITAGVIAVVGAGGALALRLRRPARTLPVLAQRLPPNTVTVFERRAGESVGEDLDDLGSLPDVYVASGLGSLCGERDIVRTIALSRGKDLDELKRLGALDLKQLRPELECGDVLRRGLSSPSVTTVLFRDGEALHAVTALRTRATELPAAQGWGKRNFSGLAGFCRKPEGAADECGPKARAAFHDGETWVFGERDDVESFARSYTTAREELSTTVDILQQAASETEPSDRTRLVARPEQIDWKAPCAAAAPVGKHDEFVAACFPDGQQKLLDGVTSKVRGIAVQSDAVARAERFHVVYTLLARDADAAKDIEKDLLDFVRDWRAQLANGEAAMAKLVRSKSEYVIDRFWEAVFDAYLRSLRGARVTRSGAVVKLVIDDGLRPEEAKAMREFTGTRTPDRKAAAEIAEAVLAGSAPPERALATFYGPEVARWIVAPRASDEDCGALQQKLQQLVGGPDGQISAKSSLDAYRKECVGGVLPPELRECQLGAESVQAFFRCRVPWSPYVVAATKRLQGQWEVESVSGSPDWQLRSALRSMRIELQDERAATSIAGTVSEGASTIRASQTGSAHLTLTVMGKEVDGEATWSGDDTLALANLFPRVERLTLKRAKFDESLLVLAKASAARKAPGFDACLSGCLGRGGAVGDCDHECVAAAP